MKRCRSYRQYVGAAILGVALVGPLTACAPSQERRGTGEYVDDKVINTRVKAALIAAKDIDASDINADTFRGVVQLSGFVHSRQMQDRAVSVARGVPGVKEVKDDMRLRPPR